MTMYLKHFGLLFLITFTRASPIVENTNVEDLKIYLQKYSTDYIDTGLEPAQSVDGDEIVEKIKFSENPLIVDAVLTLQETLGINQTGTITQPTLSKMGQSRCGVRDPVFDPTAPGKYEVQSTWMSKRDHKTGLYTVTYSFPKRKTPKSLKFQSFKRGVTLAMCTWETISNVRFKNLGLGKTTADVQITFEKANHGDGHPFDGKGGTLGHAFYPEDGRLHFDESESWYLAKPGKQDDSKKDIYTVTLHELGHTLGLLHSKRDGAVMQAFYRFFGTFDTFDMPGDERSGVAQMYGERRGGDPSSDVDGACYEAKKKYGIDLSRLKEEPSATRKAVFEDFSDPLCADDLAHSKNCISWKTKGFCANPLFASVMLRRCMKTCAFCPGPPPRNKTPDKVSSLSSSICGINRYDSMTTTYDQADGFAAYIFKDDYYFQSKMSLSPIKYDTHNLFNNTDVLKGSYKWDTDPKTILPGLFKINSENFLHRTRKIQALAVSKEKYFAFEGNAVHYYRRDMGEIVYNKTYLIGELFTGFPHQSIDAAHVSAREQLGENSIYTIFKKDKMWQYEEMLDPREPGNALFWPIKNKTNIDIAEWHGIPACNIDSVFEYREVPYFLKGNIFWPAVDSEPPIARDVTYNFFRCWQNEPENLEIPTTCETPDAISNLTDGGNGAKSSQILSKTLLLFIVVLNSLFVKSFAAET